MHIGNSVICPVTGIPMLAIMGIGLYYAYKKAKNDFKTINKATFISLSILVFSLQMINFSIPMTGSSGHIIGTILLASLLSPSLAFIAMTLILLVQALFFADGGILSLGCNIFNMAFIPCYIIYPVIFKPLNNKNKPVLACLLSSIAALQIGALAVVLEIWLSGSLSSNFLNFMNLMLLIHIPISIIEGIFTSLICVLMKKGNFIKYSSLFFSVFAIILASITVKYASTKPDGLEWSLLNISDSLIFQTQGYIYTISETIQNKMAVLTNINPIIANITGLFIITFFIIVAEKVLSLGTVNIKNEQ